MRVETVGHNRHISTPVDLSNIVPIHKGNCEVIFCDLVRSTGAPLISLNPSFPYDGGVVHVCEIGVLYPGMVEGKCGY